jgi:predicted ATPase
MVDDLKFDLEIKNFLAIKKADLKSNQPLTVLVAPNRAGKTQILYLLYSIFKHEAARMPYEVNIDYTAKEATNNFIAGSSLSNVFLIDKPSAFVNWSASSGYFKIKNSEYLDIEFSFNNQEKFIDSSKITTERLIKKTPIYLSPAGMGDFYKGIMNLIWFYPSYKILSSAITDFLGNLMTVQGDNTSSSKTNAKLLKSFEEKFQAKFFVKENQVHVQENGKELPIKNTASGLKSLSWLYLMIKYDLLGEVLLLDEPEVNLHPAYLNQLAAFLGELIHSGVKFYLSTHSDFLLEAVNKNIKAGEFKADVWNADLTLEGAMYQSYEANSEQLIDTKPLNQYYIETLNDLFKSS